MNPQKNLIYLHKVRLVAIESYIYLKQAKVVKHICISQNTTHQRNQIIRQELQEETNTTLPRSQIVDEIISTQTLNEACDKVECAVCGGMFKEGQGMRRHVQIQAYKRVPRFKDK